MCGSLEEALGCDYQEILGGESPSIDDVYGLVMTSITLTDAQRIPGLELPAGSRSLLPDLWRFLAHYPLVNASSTLEGADDYTFYNTAYLATHIGYIPTGYGRHPIYIDDAPWLYRFLRENFYAVLEMGELDLVAEFVDLLRQYGGTEETDLQVRDGTRYLLRLFHSAGDRWMAHRESYETPRIESLRPRPQGLDGNRGRENSRDRTRERRHLRGGVSSFARAHPLRGRPPIAPSNSN